MKIIIVGFDPTLRGAMKGLIATRHSVTGVYSSLRALQTAFDEGRPPDLDLAVVDDLDGRWEEAIHLLKGYRPDGIAIGFSSGEIEFGDYFVKKVGKLDNLLEAIDDSLRKKYGPQTPTGPRAP